MKSRSLALGTRRQTAPLDNVWPTGNGRTAFSTRHPPLPALLLVPHHKNPDGRPLRPPTVDALRCLLEFSRTSEADPRERLHPPCSLTLLSLANLLLQFGEEVGDAGEARDTGFVFVFPALNCDQSIPRENVPA